MENKPFSLEDFFKFFFNSSQHNTHGLTLLFLSDCQKIKKSWLLIYPAEKSCLDLATEPKCDHNDWLGIVSS
jgi:hypothetical protein